MIGRRVLLRRHCQEVPNYAWVSDDDYYFTLTDTEGYTGPLEASEPTDFPAPYAAGSTHVVWNLGNAFLKIIVPWSPQTTREHVTIEAVQAMLPSFDLPRVLYHSEWDGCYSLTISRVPGKTLKLAWTSMSEPDREACIDRVADIIEELTAHTSDTISGVEGSHLSETYLACSDTNFSPEHHLLACQVCKMDDSEFLFYHCDLGPQNIMYDDLSNKISIIDWDTAGYVPRQWFRTKACVSAGLDFSDGYEGDSTEWRARLQRKLGERGFEERAEEWMAWRQTSKR